MRVSSCHLLPTDSISSQGWEWIIIEHICEITEKSPHWLALLDSLQQNFSIERKSLSLNHCNLESVFGVPLIELFDFPSLIAE
jgi:hypothetical protein